MSRKLMINNHSKLDCDFYLKNKSFNGVSDYIDTKLNLFDTNTDWCIYINFTNLDSRKSYQNIIHNVTENSFHNGVALAKNLKNLLDIGGNDLAWWSVVDMSTTPNVKLVVFRRGSEVGYKLSNKNNSRYNYKFSPATQNLLIGCYQTVAGVKGRFWKGIIHELIVYKNKTITDQEIDHLLQRGE